MIYKGFDISYIQPIVEKQEIDDNGNVVGYRDSWQCGDGWYQADRASPARRIRVKSGINRLKHLIDKEEKAK